MAAILFLFLSLGFSAHAGGLERIEVYFSPKGGCTEAIVRELKRATNSVRIQSYSFTSAPIAEAVVAAHRRGVKVTAVLDDSQESEKYSSATFLHNQGVETLTDAKHAIAHNKTMFVDGSTVITGSFNFTKAAEERNAENLLIIRDAVVAGKYLENFEDHARHARPYQRNEGEKKQRKEK